VHVPLPFYFKGDNMSVIISHERKDCVGNFISSFKCEVWNGGYAATLNNLKVGVIVWSCSYDGYHSEGVITNICEDTGCILVTLEGGTKEIFTPRGLGLKGHTATAAHLNNKPEYEMR
jgi:hypothetical protein